MTEPPAPQPAPSPAAPSLVASHPNAIVGTVSGIGGGEIVVNVAHALGYSISTGWGITIAGAVTGLVLFIGKHGLAGIKARVLHGTAAG